MRLKTKLIKKDLGGSRGFQNFGSGTRATLHGWEQVINTDEAQGIAGMVHQVTRKALTRGFLGRMKWLWFGK